MMERNLSAQKRRFIHVAWVGAYALVPLLACGMAWAQADNAPPPMKTATELETPRTPNDKNVLWADPGDVASLNMVNGFGGEDGAPAPPFAFVKEDPSGSTPKILVKDAKGRTWSVKWGDEVMPEVFSNRMVWATGYFVETEYYVGTGTITGNYELKRASKFVGKDGVFAPARFQLRADSPRFLKNSNWSWKSNPFLGTPQLNGLKVMVMLLSNWDTKDARDINPNAFMPKLADSNLGVFEDKSEGTPKFLYFVDDWGATMGKWGGATKRSKRECKGYAEQTAEFVLGSSNGIVDFGYSGKHNASTREGIRVTDVQWLMQYLGKISDEQIKQALAGAGASPEELACYGASVRQRIEKLRSIAGTQASAQ